MSMRVKLCLGVFVLSLLYLCTGLALANNERDVTVDPEMRLGHCQSQCERQQGEVRALCRFQCQQKYGEEAGEERETEEEEDNPYVFEDQHFTSVFKNPHGRVEVLQKFTKKSKLLLGIENYRVLVTEANPYTFGSPSHWDADAVLFVAKGRGTISMILEEKGHEVKRHSFNIECGDVLRVRAGTTVYLINRDENEKLFIVNLLQTVNLPGEYKVFSATGGDEDSMSFYEAFSWELLEAALKTERRRLEHIFKQNQESFVKASREQIQSMSHRDEGGSGGGSIWPFGTESIGPFNILKNSVIKNNHGQLFEVEESDFKQHLQDLDVTVSLVNITRGSMVGPYYNSKATQVSIVLEGEGYFEMACPHVSGGWQPKKRGLTYQKVSSRLSREMVYVVPSGHPVASVASKNKNLVILCFEINVQGNTRYPLAGKSNIVNKMEREAKQLAFGVTSREVDQAFGRQSDEWFFPGPSKGHAHGWADA